MSKMHVKKGDTVLILSGEDRGKKGKVLEVSPEGRQGHRRGPQHGEKAC